MDNKQKKLAFLGVLLLGCVATSWLHDGGLKQQAVSKPLLMKQTAGNNEKLRQEKTIEVYVSGAVREAGIYKLPAGARAVDALAAAGGMSEDAQKDRVNLAKKLKDGSHVYVPFVKNSSKSKQMHSGTKQGASEAKRTVTGSAGSAQFGEESFGGAGSTQFGEESFGSGGGRVNLNTATQAELMALPGIGEATANRIIALRRVRRLQKVEDLLQVRGIGQAKLAKLRPYVRVE
ncbi:MAG: helix-hairpin-helix domain-containing protein [Phascolarctobacterium sp.]